MGIWVWVMRHHLPINFIETDCWRSIWIKVHTWWRHQMETFSASLALCAGNSPVADEFPSQRPVTRSFDVFFDLHLNKRLSKQSWGRWFETPLRSLWRHRNGFASKRAPISEARLTCTPLRISNQIAYFFRSTWWRRQMEAFSALLAICTGKQSWGWWFETPWRPSWRHCYECQTKPPFDTYFERVCLSATISEIDVSAV